MNDILKSKLEVLAQDKIMMSAIKELFNERIDKEKPTIEVADNNNVLGQKYRAYEKSKKILSGVMTDIETYNVKKTKSKEFNKGK